MFRVRDLGLESFRGSAFRGYGLGCRDLGSFSVEVGLGFSVLGSTVLGSSVRAGSHVTKGYNIQKVFIGVPY